MAKINIGLKNMPLENRGSLFREVMESTGAPLNHFRRIISPMDREVEVIDHEGQRKKMLMFGSNNYLGLANHPKLFEKIQNYIQKYGIGIGGPAILNGYSESMAKLEEKISNLKGTEDAMIFSSGYGANLGLIKGLCQPDDLILSDEYSHASLNDGITLAGCKAKRFRHNDMNHLEALLKKHASVKNKIVSVEGIYSMDGDMAPLDEIIPLCNNYKAFLLLDDAHGTGVIGEHGEGTHSLFTEKADHHLNLGTFSKSFAVTGGFVAGDKDLIYHLRYCARSYFFSAALPPIALATILSSFEILEEEYWRITKLHENIQYLSNSLLKRWFCAEPKGGIITLKIPEGANLRAMTASYQKAGIFINAIEFPAVSVNKQRFRVSLNSNHTKDDLDKLIETTENIYKPYIA